MSLNRFGCQEASHEMESGCLPTPVSTRRPVRNDVKNVAWLFSCQPHRLTIFSYSEAYLDQNLEYRVPLVS